MDGQKIPNWVQLQMKVITGEVKTPRWENKDQSVYIPRPEEPLETICTPEQIKSLGHGYHDYTWAVNNGVFFLFEDGKIVSVVPDAVLDEETGVSGFFLFEDIVVIYWSIINSDKDRPEGLPTWKYFLDFKTINLFTNQPQYHEESCHDQVINVEGDEYSLEIDTENWMIHCSTKDGISKKSFDVQKQSWDNPADPILDKPIVVDEI